MFISVITIQELYEGKSTLNEGELKEMLSVIAPLEILEYNREIAEIAGTVARDSKTTICIFNDFKLFTLNITRFKDIPDLELYNLI